MIGPIPIVLIEIDLNSRLSFLQTDGVHVAFLDRRVDPILVLWPEKNQIEAILARLIGVPLASPGSDDPLRSAEAAIRRVHSGLIVIAGNPSVLTKFGENPS